VCWLSWQRPVWSSAVWTTPLSRGSATGLSRHQWHADICTRIRGSLCFPGYRACRHRCECGILSKCICYLCHNFYYYNYYCCSTFMLLTYLFTVANCGHLACLRMLYHWPEHSWVTGRSLLLWNVLPALVHLVEDGRLLCVCWRHYEVKLWCLPPAVVMVHIVCLSVCLYVTREYLQN